MKTRSINGDTDKRIHYPDKTPTYSGYFPITTLDSNIMRYIWLARVLRYACMYTEEVKEKPHR